jgi:hypothetical protein
MSARMINQILCGVAFVCAISHRVAASVSTSSGFRTRRNGKHQPHGAISASFIQGSKGMDSPALKLLLSDPIRDAVWVFSRTNTEGEMPWSKAWDDWN